MKLAISFLLTKFAYANLEAKLFDVNLLRSCVVILITMIIISNSFFNFTIFFAIVNFFIYSTFQIA